MDRVLESDSLRASVSKTGSVLVPTMGALHEGHLTLVRLGKSEALRRDCKLVVSIFVNPDQFNDPADLQRYPRPIERDLGLLEAEGVDIAFTPAVEDVYPDDQPDAAPQPAVPEVGRLPGLEDAFRPGHFQGVCRVVSRLFDLCQPVAAVFGEKDWQQTRVVAAMCRQQARMTEILVGPTVREADGLAMSSRNQHLGPEQREHAGALWRSFQEAIKETDRAVAESRMRRVLTDAGFAVEYATIRDAETLMPSKDPTDQPLRMLAAGVVGGVRLLDNAPWRA
ncbi:MAG: pantoate--beta-alanine ligase [Planctomycetota bacterium]